jgi:hypothetical protein
MDWAYCLNVRVRNISYVQNFPGETSLKVSTLKTGKHVSRTSK